MNWKWNEFASHLSYFAGDLTDPATGEAFGRRLNEFDQEWDCRADRIFYLSISPRSDDRRGQAAGAVGYLQGLRARPACGRESRLDATSTRPATSTRLLTSLFAESQIYRIDHYLGKETVQNILAFRFANSLFEPVWNRRYIDHVQITVAEAVGVEERGGVLRSGRCPA
jgi:glucose-6-phosphate 1-dehydrogenase